ncbi:MAG: FecR domain-containing protein [Burkholderiaceae bacterium]|nr:FecR domain-containing protein [Burkholderiaceae bacterium]
MNIRCTPRRMPCAAIATLWCGVLAFALAAPMAARAQTSETTAAIDAWSYRIVPGDTLIGISDEYMVRPADWPRLQRLNRIADPLRLVPGSEVRIPTDWLRQMVTVAEAVFVRGDVMVRHSPSEPAVTVPIGATLRAGDVVRTAADSSLTLRFADGSRLLVVPDSEVAIVELLAVGRAARPSLKVRLERGSADALVVPRPARDTRFEIRTPAVNLGVRGTEFRARVDPNPSVTRAEVLVGSVVATGIGAVKVADNRTQNGVTVDAGLGIVAEAGRPIAAPQRLIGAPDLSAVEPLLERVPLRLSWPAMPGARGYRAQIYAADSSDQLLLDGVFTDASARWADLPDGRYRLRARALDAQSLEGLDASATFVLNARPEPPFTSAPANGGNAYGEAAELRWARPMAAARFRLQVATDPDFKSALFDSSDLTETSRSMSLPPGRYHWRVASIAADGDLGPFGDVQSYTQKPEPVSPALDPPEPGADGLLLRWQRPEAGRKVRFQVATDGDFAQVVLDETTDAAQTLLKYPAPGTYYLRARTIESDGFEGPFGTPQQIDVPRSPWWWLVPGGLMLLLL